MNKVIILIPALFLTACAATVTYEPIVDLKKVDRNQYAQDLTECQQYAMQVENNAVAGAVVMALIGAGVGAAVGDGFGKADDLALYGAGVGAVSGAAGGAVDHAAKSQSVVENCLHGRGYKVLGKR